MRISRISPGTNFLLHLLLRHMTLDHLQGKYLFCPIELPFIAYCKTPLAKQSTCLIYCSIGSDRARWFSNFCWRGRRVVLLLSCQLGHWGFDFLLALLLSSNMSIRISGRQSFHVESFRKDALPDEVRLCTQESALRCLLVCLSCQVVGNPG